MLRLHAKIGTHGGKVILVGWKHYQPSVGDAIKFRPFPYQKGDKWQDGIVDEIKDTGWYNLYFISRH